MPLANEDVSYHKILSIGTDRSEQILQTQIRLFQKEESDGGLRALDKRKYLLIIRDNFC